MRLVLYEWKKMFTLKIRCILLMLFSLNIGIYYIYIIPSIPTIEERNIRHKWEQELANKGEDITNSIQFIQKELEKLTPGENETLKVSNEKNMMELAVLFDIRHQYMAILEYQQFISSLKERANYIKDVSVFNKAGGFSQKNIEKTVKDFEKVEEIEIHPMDDKGMQNLHQFYLTDFFVLLFACLLSVQEYGSDFRSGMGNLIQGTPNGKIKLRFSQIQATGMGILMVALLLYGFNICITGICIGFGNLSYYVQGMSMFRNMSFPCTVGIYLVLYMSWKLFVIWFVSLIFQLFAVLLNGKNIAWIFSGGVLVISFGLWFYLPDSPLTKIFRYLNVIGLLDVRQIIGNYQNLKIFETPVLLFDAAIVFVLIVGIGLILGILFGKKFEISNIKIEFPKRNRKKVWTHGFAYEFNKVVVNQKVQWVLLALIGVSFLYAGIEKRQISAKEFYYEKYINEYEGVYTDEKAKDIKGIVEKQQYSGSEERDAVESLQCQSEYLMQLKDENKGYVNLLFWREILLNEQLEIKNMLFIVIAMLISVCNLFYYDRKKMIDQLLRTTPKWKKIFLNKVRLMVLLGGSCSLIVWGCTYLKFFLNYNTKGYSFSIRCIPEFAKLKYSGTILSYVLITLLFRVLIGMYIGIVLGILSQVFIIPIQNISCGVLLFILPLCLCYIGQMGYENPLIHFINIYLSSILKPIKFLTSFPSKWFLTGKGGLGVFIGIPIILIYVGWLMWKKQYKY